MGSVLRHRLTPMGDPKPPMPKAPSGPWFNDIAAFLGKAYWAPDTSRVMAFATKTYDPWSSALPCVLPGS
jgi:hypothetical protein